MRFSPLILLLPALLFLACGNEKNTEINDILDQREKAFETRDTELYSKLISTKYSDTVEGKEIGKEEIINKFKINTTPFDRIDITHSDRDIEISGNTAKTVQKTVASLQIEDESSTYEIREIINLSIEDGTWKISKESRIDLFRGFVFGGN